MMLWAPEDPKDSQHGWHPDKSDPNQSKRLTTTINGYYASSLFKCAKIRPSTSLQDGANKSGFWICETRLDTGCIGGMIVKPWRAGVDYAFIKDILKQAHPGLVQLIEVSSIQHGPIDDGLCMRSYLMNLWEFCSADRQLTMSTRSLLLAGADLVRGVSSLHSLRDNHSYGLIHCSIRPQHFLCNTQGQWFLTGFDDIQPTSMQQDHLRLKTTSGSHTLHPVCCPPETLARLAFAKIDGGDAEMKTPAGVRMFQKLGTLALQPLTQAYDLFGLGCCLMHLLHTPTESSKQEIQHLFKDLITLFPPPHSTASSLYDYDMLRSLFATLYSRSRLPDDLASSMPEDIKQLLQRLLSLCIKSRVPAAIALNIFEIRIRALEVAELETQPAPLPKLLVSAPVLPSPRKQLRTTSPIALNTTSASGLEQTSTPSAKVKTEINARPKRSSASQVNGAASIKASTPRVTRSRRSALTQLDPNSSQK